MYAVCTLVGNMMVLYRHSEIFILFYTEDVVAMVGPIYRFADL